MAGTRRYPATQRLAPQAVTRLLGGRCFFFSLGSGLSDADHQGVAFGEEGGTLRQDEVRSVDVSPALRPSMLTSTAVGTWVASASRETVVASRLATAPGATSPETWIAMSTVTFSPAFTVCRSTCSMICFTGSRWMSLTSVRCCSPSTSRRRALAMRTARRGGPARQVDVDRLCAVAVDDGRDLAGHACAAGETLAEFGAQFCGELLLRHVYSLITVAPGKIRAGLSARAEVWRPSTPGGRPLSGRSACVEGDADPVDNGDPQPGSTQCGPDVLSLAKVSPRV